MYYGINAYLDVHITTLPTLPPYLPPFLNYLSYLLIPTFIITSLPTLNKLYLLAHITYKLHYHLTYITTLPILYYLLTHITNRKFDHNLCFLL